ncbi:putative NAD-dependent epimerase/dehydratase [uncultured virus]|uniref:Putative NAD-dependent epimerase/dehydratase n=1 Tax=uncultured virus TaxID=340016 RepID=A0A218MKD6_9VIRU|nr:putative NAD-dependent epimerase/dehydratase [uncultured virus]
MKVFITGIGGLLGSNLARFCINKGEEVAGVDNFIGGIQSNVPEKAKLHNFDIRDLDLLKKAMEGADIVFHAAALPYEGLSVFSPKVTVDSIITNTLSVASACIHHDIKLLVNCSSMARYGKINTPPFDESMPCVPVDPYGLAKLQAEQQLKLLNDLHGLKYVTVVPHNVIGIGQRYNDPFRNVAAIMINRVLQGKKIIIYGDGSQKRSFSNVLDCVKAVYRLMQTNRDVTGQVYNIGPDDNEISIKDLAYKIGHIANVYPSLEYFPDRPAEVKNAFCSSTKIAQDFSYKAVIPLEETLTQMIDWIRPRTKPFEYHLPIEYVKENTPKTWTERLI